MTEAEVAQLYRDYGYVLFRRCLSYLGDSAAAQDAVQEVFVRALRSADGFRGDAKPRTWLCRISDHLCIDMLRRRKRNPVQALASADEDGAAAASAPHAAIALDDHASFAEVRGLLAELDPDERQLAVLYYLDELTQEELALELGLSRRTIGKRLQALRSRAQQLLRTEESV